MPIETAYLRYAVCGCYLCIKNANCYRKEVLTLILRSGLQTLHGAVQSDLGLVILVHALLMLQAQKVDLHLPCIRLTNIGATALAQRSMRPDHWAAIPSIQR